MSVEYNSFLQKKFRPLRGFIALRQSLLILIISGSLNGLFAQNTSVPENGPAVFKYANGKVSSEGNFKNGKPDGYWKAYFETGQLKSEGNRVNGLLDGTWKFYDEKGQLVSENNYRADKKQGFQKEYYPDGKVSMEQWMKDGVVDSVINYYNPKGYLEKVVPISKEVENGVAKEYAEDGRIITLTTYRNGFFVKEEKVNRYDKFGFKQGVWKEFYPAGNPKTEGTWKDDRKSGAFKWYSPEGIVERMEIWKNGELVKDETANVTLDIKRDYYNNGRPKSSVNLINGVKEGVSRDYDMKGTITGSKLYDKNKVIAEGGTVDASGFQQGNWKYFYPDGSVKSEGSFKDGKRDGLWIFYYPNKKIQQKGNYSENKPSGEWKWFYPDEKLLREETYKDGKEDGPSSEYDDQGVLIAQGNYVAGLKEGPWKFKNGEYLAEGNYVEGNMDGIWKQTYLKGQLAFEGEYFEGQENGSHKYYYDNGKLKEERTYRLGQKEGTWKSYDETGTLILTIEYKNNQVKKMEGVKVEGN